MKTNTQTHTHNHSTKKKWIMPKSVTKLTCYLCIQRYEQTESKCWTNNNDDDVNDVWKIESNKQTKNDQILMMDRSIMNESLPGQLWVKEKKFETVFFNCKICFKIIIIIMIMTLTIYVNTILIDR